MTGQDVKTAPSIVVIVPDHTPLPQDFARTTCADLGLQTDMEPAIAHKIRENIFRAVITWLDDVRRGVIVEGDTDLTPTQSDIKLQLVSAQHTVDMMTNLWKRAKPISADDSASIPQPVLPADRNSNACAWIKVVLPGDDEVAAT